MPTRPSPSTPPPFLPISLPHPTPSSHPSPPKRPITRSQHGIYKPKKSFTLLTSMSKSPLPHNPISALRDPNWKKSMDDEYDALINNKIWELVPRPPNVNVIRSMWIFYHKYKSDGSFERHKAHLVSEGKTQQVGVDCGETFSSVVKPETIRIVLSLALSYAAEIIDRAGMSSCKPSPTPVDTKPKISAATSIPFEDPSLYRSLVVALQYLTFTRPEITYVVQQGCLFMHDPREEHMHALKRILHYIQGTMDLGLHLYPSSTSTILSYTDADWDGCLDTRRSTFGYCVFLGDNLMSWSAKQQPTLSRSSVEAKY
uniref:Reverse transcriptase Ty1/copia-type domain-containing protein n=1 Tax=Cajanus cajan TaxID=3821 RepID=A0A151S5N2_CAJCA|nr:hypothetical protein KK1_028174 [Cajanus cajan]